MKKIYIFDFDGVICNSYYECFLIAYKVVFKKNLDDFKIFYKKNLNRIFYYNSFVKKGVDFCKIFFLFKKKNKKKNLNFNIDKKFEKKFYLERQKLKKNKNFWYKLNPFYKHILTLFKNRRNDDVFIVTFKDYDSIKILLKKNKIKIPKKNILCKDNMNNKQDLITKKFKGDYNISFFDDCLENLINLNSKKINKFLVLNKEKKYVNIKNILKKNSIKSIKHDHIVKIVE